MKIYLGISAELSTRKVTQSDGSKSQQRGSMQTLLNSEWASRIYRYQIVETKVEGIIEVQQRVCHSPSVISSSNQISTNLLIDNCMVFFVSDPGFTGKHWRQNGNSSLFHSSTRNVDPYRHTSHYGILRLVISIFLRKLV